MKYASICLIFVLLALGMTASVVGQSSQIDRANELFRAGQYARAISLYEEALALRESHALQSKLAYCYRMINRQDKAAPLYAAVIQSGKAKADDFYYYGESLMSAGHYTQARQQFERFLDLKPGDEDAIRMISHCDYAPRIKDRFGDVHTQPFPHNSDMDDNAPVAWQDGIIFASDRKTGFRLLKEKSDWTGRDYISLYFAPSAGQGSFSEPELYSSKLNELNKNTGNASFAADGSQVFFSRNSDELSKQNSYNLQLYSAESAGNGKWKNARILPFCSPEWNYMHPAIAPDGKTLFFVTDKKEGQGGTDLYMSTLSKKGWSPAVNLGPGINTPANEGFPFAGHDGNLYFCSKGHPGLGGFDIFFSERLSNGTWSTPVNIGRPFNSTYDDISIFLRPDLRSGLFTSSRDGGDDDIYLFQIGASLPSSEEPVTEGPVAAVVVPQEPKVALSAPAPSVSESVPDTPVASVGKKKEKRQPDEGDTRLRETPPAEPGPVLSKSQSSEPVPLPATALQTLLLDTIDDVMTPPTGKGNTLSDLRWFLQYRQPVAGKAFIVEDIYYPSDQIAVTPGIALQLDKVADLLLQYPALRVEMGVHTESTGDDARNLQLSRFRSEIVVEYLVFKGVPPQRLHYKGYGETRPLNGCVNGVPCSPADLRANHRVELMILGNTTAIDP